MNLTFADLGTGALRAALPLAIWGIGAAAYAAAKRDGRALASARWSALITFPFSDTGGDQSFAIAMLDSLGNGVVLSSLHSRTDTRVFAKPVQGGRSKFQLSDEEQDAIKKALAPSS